MSDNSRSDTTKVITKDKAFTRTITFDNVTGKIITTTDWTPNNTTFEKVPTPVVQDYHANKKEAGGLTATPQDPNVKDEVIYYPNGKIVPVDPEGNHIPGTNTPSFPTDPDDPTKVDTGIVPNVPDTWTPENPNEKPGDPVDPNPNDPSKNVEIPFKPVTPTPTTDKGSITVTVYDVTDNKDLPEYGKSSGSEDVGTKFTYDKATTITDLEDKGYRVINPNVTIPNEIAKGNQTVTIYVEHGITPVNPDNPGKPGEPINPNDPDGPKWPDDTGEDSLTKTITRTIDYIDNTGKTIASPVVQTVKFTESGTLDKVTGKWITPLTWNKTSEEVPLQVSPTIKGYHVVSVSRDADGNNVGAATIENTDSSYKVIVTYAPNGTTVKNNQTIPSSQTVKFVDENGKEIYQQNKQTYTFIYSGDTVDETTGAIIDQGKWNEQTHTYDTVSVPVIDGYVAISGYINQDGKFVAGGLTATHENPNVVATVVYAKIGKIVPVDPEGKDIPDAPTPNYKNDPNNPTKVVPNEPVPSIPGYTPNVPNITPDNPTKDTPVPYTPNVNDQGQVIVIVHDNTTKTDIPQYGYDSGEQKVGDKVDYDKAKVITNLENQGYKVINPDVTIPSEITKGTQKVTIYVEHDLVPVNPDNPGQPGQPINPNDPDGPKWPDDTGKDALIKTGTQIIHYEGAGSQTPKDNVETTEFNHDMVIDKVTGKIVKDNGWTPSDHKFSTVTTPVIEGYHADKEIAGGLTVTPDKLKAEETVTYMPNGHIVPVDPEGNKIPNAPTPQYPTDPDNPTKVTPNEPVPSIPGYTPEVPTVTPKNPGKDTTVIYTPIPKDKGQIIIVVHDNTTNTDIPQYGYDSGEQKVGDKIDYDKTKVITDLENQGYKVINPDVTIPDEITKGSQKVVIYVEHGTTPITPDKPGKPGQPINPNDPNGPKWPDDTGKDEISKDITRTITFVNNEGKEIHTPVEQTVHFTAHGVIDNVTGKWITPLTWSPAQTVNSQNVPFVQNYHVTTISKDGNNNNNTEVKAVIITHDDTSYKVVVTYEPNGYIVPVDPEGNKIPNVPTPQYPTDPDNPTKVTPNEPVPSIPGYTPEVPTVTPKNPGKDTTVIYTPIPKDKGRIIIVVHDNTTNTNIPQYGYDSGEQKVGDKIDYDKTKVITNLENQGYKVINPDITIPGEITKGPQKITIYVEHDLVPVNPDNPGKPGQPINPNDPNGPKWPDDTGKDALTKIGTQTITYQGAGSQTPKESVTTVSFEHHLVIDKVTGKIVKDNGWTPASQTYQKITTPTIAGYTPNQSVVGGDIVKATESNINRHYTVTYTKYETPVTPISPTPEPSVTTVIGKQTITFIDGDTNTPLKEADVQTHTFTITNGVPDQNSYTFGKITVPVIKGYVAEIKNAGGKTVTPQDPDASVVVIYHKIGKIVPVDPDHNPIPDADTPQYENDPNDPTKVEPNEPVPSIDGYTPSQSTVTPDNPTKNTEVVYTKNTTPDEPDEPNEPDDTSDEPENPKPPKKHRENNKPKPSTPKNDYNYNNAPHSQSDYWNNIGPHGQWSNNVAPHGQNVNGWSNNIGPHGEHVDANGNIISASGTIIGYIDKNGKVHYTKTLPKTGSNQNQSEIAAAIGLTATGLTMLGLAGVKKRRKR